MLPPYSTNTSFSRKHLLSTDPDLSLSRKREFIHADQHNHPHSLDSSEGYWLGSSSPPMPSSPDRRDSDDLESIQRGIRLVTRLQNSECPHYRPDRLRKRQREQSQQVIHTNPQPGGRSQTSPPTFSAILQPALRTRSTQDRLKRYGSAEAMFLALIDQAIDNPEPNFENIMVFNMDNTGLNSIPDHICDLDKLVTLGSPINLQLFLANNNLTRMNLQLFELSRLSVLSLRCNQLVEIPPAIENLKCLKELNVSNNFLKFLPAEILSLGNLTNLVVLPNPFEQIPLEHQPATLSIQKNRGCLYRRVEINGLPSLVELSLRSLISHGFCTNPKGLYSSSSLLQDLPQRLRDIINRGFQASARGLRCSFRPCSEPFTQPAAHVTEWWKLLGHGPIPLRRNYCSIECLNSDPEPNTIDLDSSASDATIAD